MRTFVLLAGLTASFLAIGSRLGGDGGIIIAFAIALAMNLFGYWHSDKMVLRMHGARRIGADDAPGLYGIVEQLALGAAVPMPAAYIIENDQPNAFATGRDPAHAAVAVTTGSMARLDHEETAGVLGHGLADVRNRGTLVMTITATLAGAIDSGSRVRYTGAMMAPPPCPRSVAFAVLRQTLDQGRPLDDVLAADSGLSHLSARDRAFARLVIATTLRRLGQIDELIDRCITRPLPKRARAVHDILRLGIAQLLFLGTPAHAAVATTVELAQSLGFGAHKGLVNAVLRRLAREGPERVAAQDAARLNTPDWLWQNWCGAYGEETTRAIAAQHLAEPPLDITVKDDPEGWAGRLEAFLLVTGSLRRKASPASAPPDPAAPRQRTPVPRLAGYDQGAWWVQDAAAAIPARLFGDVRGQTVIDLCAAPGGKTAQLAAAGANVIAVERSRERLAVLEQNLKRLKLGAEIITADATAWRPPAPAPMVLLDAPCTATGTLRRHPDIGHLKSAAGMARFIQLQDRLLAAAAAMVAPGGELIYAVCSLQPEECEARIDALLSTGAPFVRHPITPGEIGGAVEMTSAVGDLRTLPCHMADQGGIDGFYAARLRRLDPGGAGA